jgi:hypothetical protein
MIEDVDEKDVEDALAKARKFAEGVEQAAGKSPPELANALRRSAHAMVYNLEKALEVLQQERRRRRPITYS